MQKSEKDHAYGLPFDEDEFFISFEMNNATTAQLLYYRAVILPELQAIVNEHASNLIELGKSEV